jgi:hypothetical protein
MKFAVASALPPARASGRAVRVILWGIPHNNHSLQTMFSFGAPFDSNDWNHYTVLTPEMVMHAWGILVEDVFPWNQMPRDDRAGYVRVIVDELLDFGADVDVAERECRLVRVARMHGAFRRAQRCSESTVGLDFVAVRQALCDALRESGAAPATVRQATRCLLPDCRLVRRAAHDAFSNA